MGEALGETGITLRKGILVGEIVADGLAVGLTTGEGFTITTGVESGCEQIFFP